MLENYTYEELKKIVEEVPEGWEDWSPAVDNHLEGYYKNDRNCYYNMGQRWVSASMDNTFHFYTKQRITEELSKKGYQVTVDALMPIQREDIIAQALEANVSRGTVTIDIGEFVNYVKVEDGKVLVNVNKCDVEGIVGLFGGNGG